MLRIDRTQCTKLTQLPAPVGLGTKTLGGFVSDSGELRDVFLQRGGAPLPPPPKYCVVLAINLEAIRLWGLRPRHGLSVGRKIPLVLTKETKTHPTGPKANPGLKQASSL